MFHEYISFWFTVTMAIDLSVSPSLKRRSSRVSVITDMGGDKTRTAQAPLTLIVKQVLKTFKSAFMLLLVQKEQHKQSFQPHVIISVLQTFK